MFQIDTLSRPLEETNELQGRITVLHSKLDAAQVQVCCSILYANICRLFLPTKSSAVSRYVSRYNRLSYYWLLVDCIMSSLPFTWFNLCSAKLSGLNCRWSCVISVLSVYLFETLQYCLSWYWLNVSPDFSPQTSSFLTTMHELFWNVFRSKSWASCWNAVIGKSASWRQHKK